MVSGYIDRIEENVAVILLEDADYCLHYPAALLPEDIGEGDYIILSMEKDERKNAEMLAEALALMED